MPTQTKSTTKKSASNGVEGLAERVVDFARKTSLNYVDTAESASYRVADLQEQLGATSPIKWISDATEAQASIMRGVTETYASAGRKLIS
jgi:hypothetical protein